MSKIQKALRAVRGLQADNPDVREKAERYLAVHGPAVGAHRNGQASKPVGRDRTLRPDFFEQFEELPVARQIAIDVERLNQAGFWPLEDAAVTPGGQFGRAKRPILQIAFETGVPVGENANVMMVGSTMPGAGKTFCSINLARSIARERDVGALLIDGDVLKSSMTEAFGCTDQPGLVDYLLDSSLSLDDVLVQTDLHDIVFIPAGRKHPEATELLSSRRMKRFVQELSQRFRTRVLICDTPPLLVTNEAYAFARHAGQILLVIEAGYTSQESVQHVLQSFDRDKPVNAILNKTSLVSDVGYYGDTYGAPHGEEITDDIPVEIER